MGLGGDLVPPGVKQPEVVRGSDFRQPADTASRRLLAPAATAKQGSTYQLEDNKQVRHYINQYRSGRRASVESWLQRAGQYLPMLIDIFRQRGLPDELVFTAMIESGFNPVAVSHAGAKGLWQFMAPTARRYGLRVDEWLDERLDPEKSTVAAARHFLDLYATFGSWNLAKAAYNAGEQRVLSAIRSMGTRDFWELASGDTLKEETRNFVPAIHAAATIAREPERFGFVVTPQDPVQYERVNVPGATSLARLASLAGLPVEDLERLNPELTARQTPPGPPHALKVPPGAGMALELALVWEAASRSKRATPGPTAEAPATGVHVVQPGDTVSAIARRYGVAVSDVKQWNDLSDVSRIKPGTRLRVARVSSPQEDPGGTR
jgi:membrane-bound lytic murein transglycosylase D